MKSMPLFVVFVLQFAIAPSGFGQSQLNHEVKLGLSYILSFKGVTKELELTEEQNDRLNGLWIEIKTKLEREFKSYQANYSPRFADQEKDVLKKELENAIAEIRESETGKLNEVLLPHQLKRLKQIQFQILKRDTEGFQGLGEALKLTPKQVRKMKAIKSALTKTDQELRQRSREEQLTRNEVAEEIDAIRAQTEYDLMDLLTALQRRKLKELEGETFELQTAPSRARKQ